MAEAVPERLATEALRLDVHSDHYRRSRAARTTAELVEDLRRANPGRHITESVIRWPIRCRRIPHPQRFGGVFAWDADGVRALCRELKFKVPEVCDV